MDATQTPEHPGAGDLCTELDKLRQRADLACELLLKIEKMFGAVLPAYAELVEAGQAVRDRLGDYGFKAEPYLAAASLVQGLLAQPRYREAGRLPAHEFKVFSQAGEDGIIHEIFSRIGVRSRAFVEIGAGKGLENNTLHLLAQGWRGLWIEGDPQNVADIASLHARAFAERRLALVGEYVTPENVNALVEAAGNVGGVDFCSLDIDGNDYHVLEAMTAIRPRVMALEYNARLGPAARWVMPYDPNHRWDGSDYFGASLASFEDLMRTKGMALVGCNLMGSNAFFVREDLLAGKFNAPHTAANHFEPVRYGLWPYYFFGHPTSPRTPASVG